MQYSIPVIISTQVDRKAIISPAMALNGGGEEGSHASHVTVTMATLIITAYHENQYTESFSPISFKPCAKCTE